MGSVFLLIVLAVFLSLALLLGSSASRRTMTARKTVAGCGAIFFALYGVIVPDARSESLIMTALAVAIFCYLGRVSGAANAGDQFSREAIE